MNIGIDAHSWGQNLTGNEIYTVNLLRNLAKIDKSNNYRVYVSNKRILSDNLFKEPNFQAKFIGYTRWKRIFLSMPIELNINNVDVVHMQYFPPLFYSGKFIVTIHDVSFKIFPQWYSLKERLMFKFVKLAIENAKYIVAVSGFTKKEILTRYNMPSHKVVVIYNGVSDSFKLTEDSGLTLRVKKKYFLPDDFLLYVGTFVDLKNIPGLIRAFAIFKRTKIRKEKLVLIGDKKCNYNKISKLIEKLNLKDEVKFIGYVSESELPAIYNCAKLFVSISFYESFGLSSLEAMASGLPVITSNTSAFPEVVNEAGVMVNPYDEEAVAKAMSQILDDKDLYQSMRLKGLNQAKKFSWLETARQTLKIYERAYKEE